MEPATALSLHHQEEGGTLQQGLHGLQQLTKPEIKLARISDSRAEGGGSD